MIADAISNTAGGLSAADLIGVLAIMVTIFGLLLSAIGVLVLLQFRGLADRISELKSDNTDEFTRMRTEHHEASTAVWAEIRLMRAGLPPRALPSI